MNKQRYKPIDLYDEVTKSFRCSNCKHAHQIGQIHVNYLSSTKQATFVCTKCRSPHDLEVEPWKPKRIYLDQSLLSELSRIEITANTPKASDQSILLRLQDKLREAKQRRLICVIVSDIHISETASTPKKEMQKRIWEYSNRLADGIVGGDMIDALKFELLTILGFENRDELSAILKRDLDDLKPATHILLTNNWRLSLHQRITEAGGKERDQILPSIYEKQHGETCGNSSPGDCVTYIENIYCEELENAAIRVTEAIRWSINADEAIRLNSLPPTFTHSLPPYGQCPYTDLIFEISKEFSADDAKLAAIAEVLTEVRSRKLTGIHSLKIRSAMEGELLWKWKQSLRKNPKKFRTEYGVSRMNDISHLSVFMRLCDVVTTDNDMWNLCQLPSVIDATGTHTYMLISSKTYEKFESYLDALLQAPESPEQKATRYLFLGRTENEILNQFADEIVAGVLAKLAKSNAKKLPAQPLLRSRD